MTTTSTTLCRITLAALVAVLWLCLPTASLGQERAQTFEDAARLGLQPTPTPLVVEQPPAVYKNAALTFYTNRATFEATFPDLTEEDFEGAKTPPNNVCSDLTPLNSSTNDACYGPGAIVDGFEFNIDGNAGPPIDYALLTTGFFGAPSNVVGPNTFLDNAILDFTGADPVFAAGFNATCIFNPGPITVEVFGPGGSLGSTTFTCPSSFPGAFVGVSSDADEIVSIEFSNSGAAAEVLDDILFGGTVTIDLSLDKDVDSFNEATRRITWEITVENDNGNDTEATGVVVRDDFPAATLVDDFDASQGTFDPLTGVWDVGTLADGASATLTIEADLNAQGEFLNCAEVIAANEDDDDSTPDDGTGDDADCTLVFVGPSRDGTEFERGLGPGRLIDRGGRRFASDLSLTKEVDDETVSVGEEITYTIAVTNNGPQTNAGIVVEDILPECLDFASASASQGSYSASTGEWVLGGQLRVGQTATLEITVTVGADCEGEVTNTAEITETNLPDPDRFFVDPFDPNRPQPDETDSASITVSSASSRVAGLLAAYPNPFNPQTVIPFEVKQESAEVKLAVYDLLGRQVQVLVEGVFSAGVHQATFRAGQLPTGLYLVRLEAGGTVQTQRITLLK